MTASDRSITQDDVVILALARLNGAQRKIYSEHVAAEAHRMAPEVFGWELPEYRQKGWPDKEKVRKALIRLHSEQGGRLVEGQYKKDTSPDGWQLTPAGVRWIEQNAERVASGLNLDGPKIPKQDAARFVKNIKRDLLFKVYLAGDLESATPYDFTDMLNCSPDAPHELIRSKFDRLRSIGQLAGDPQVVEFLQDCAVKFAGLLPAAKSEENRRGIKP